MTTEQLRNNGSTRTLLEQLLHLVSCEMCIVSYWQIISLTSPFSFERNLLNRRSSSLNTGELSCHLNLESLKARPLWPKPGLRSSCKNEMAPKLYFL